MGCCQKLEPEIWHLVFSCYKKTARTLLNWTWSCFSISLSDVSSEELPGNQPVILEKDGVVIHHNLPCCSLWVCCSGQREQTQPLCGVRPYPAPQFRVKFVFVFHGKVEHIWMWLSMTQSCLSAHVSQVVKFRCTWVLACSAWAHLWMPEKSTRLLRWPGGNFLKQMEITMDLQNLVSLCTFVELHRL